MKQVVGGSPCIEEGEGGEDEGRYYGRDHTRILQGREEGETDGGREREGWRKERNEEISDHKPSKLRIIMCYLEIVQEHCTCTLLLPPLWSRSFPLRW